jgi:uncharacterized membrane protein
VIGQPLLLVAIIAGAAAFAFWLEYRFRRLRKIGSALLAIGLGALLSNAGIVTAASPVYDAVSGPVTSLAIAWLLLAVNLRDLRKAGGRMLGAFLLAALGTCVGAMVGAFAFGSFFGDATWKLAGTLTGTYSGGSLNFVAVGNALGLSESLFAGATAADAATTAFWLGVTILAPVWLRNLFPKPLNEVEVDDDGSADRESPEHPLHERASLSTADLGILLAVGFALLVAADGMAELVPSIPSVLWLTTFALVVGHFGRFKEARGAFQLGSAALQLFFVIIGIYSRIAEILVVGVEVFFFTVVVVLVHGVLVFGIGRLARLDAATLAVASQAAVGGPSSALAVAVSGRWHRLVLPGIIVGLLGYAVGTYLGFGVAYAVRGLGVGL